MGKLYEETKNIMKKYNIVANKELGQNFLVEENVVETIVAAAEIQEDDLVIEIGPGLGTLTQRLLAKSEKLIAVELDKKMVEILNDRFKDNDKFTIINGDILKINLKELIEKEKQENNINKVKVVANLPYYITTLIIMKLLEDKNDLESITIMIQKEVADRIVATPGSGKIAGAITYSVHYYSEPRNVLVVPKTSFIPEPKVNSSVIKLKVRQKPAVDAKNPDMIFKLIKYGFMFKRKNFMNALEKCELHIPKAKTKEILNKINKDIYVRAEQLSLQDFANIADMLYKMEEI